MTADLSQQKHPRSIGIMSPDFSHKNELNPLGPFVNGPTIFPALITPGTALHAHLELLQ